MNGFVKFIIFALLIAGCVYLYQNQDTIMQNAEAALKKEKTINKVNNASAEKQKYIEDAQKAIYGE